MTTVVANGRYRYAAAENSGTQTIDLDAAETRACYHRACWLRSLAERWEDGDRVPEPYEMELRSRDWAEGVADALNAVCDEGHEPFKSERTLYKLEWLMNALASEN